MEKTNEATEKNEFFQRLNAAEPPSSSPPKQPDDAESPTLDRLLERASPEKSDQPKGKEEEAPPEVVLPKPMPDLASALSAIGRRSGGEAEEEEAAKSVASAREPSAAPQTPASLIEEVLSQHVGFATCFADKLQRAVSAKLTHAATETALFVLGGGKAPPPATTDKPPLDSEYFTQCLPDVWLDIEKRRRGELKKTDQERMQACSTALGAALNRVSSILVRKGMRKRKGAWENFLKGTPTVVRCTVSKLLLRFGKLVEGFLATAEQVKKVSSAMRQRHGIPLVSFPEAIGNLSDVEKSIPPDADERLARFASDLIRFLAQKIQWACAQGSTIAGSFVEEYGGTVTSSLQLFTQCTHNLRHVAAAAPRGVQIIEIVRRASDAECAASAASGRNAQKLQAVLQQLLSPVSFI
jgi:hypothetical protein